MSSKNYKNSEFESKDLLNILSIYKWMILLISFLFLLLSNVYLYFKPSVYSTYSILEVKTRDKGSIVSDDLVQNAFYSTNKEIEKEMEILRTYNMNQKVIEQMNFETQLFNIEEYKKHELYAENIPLTINIIEIFNSEILGKEIRVIPREDGYSLEIKSSEKDKIFSTIVEEELLSLDSNKIYSYGKVVKTDYFKLSIKKIKDITQPIYFNINGGSRNIYDFIVSERLSIKQLNENAPLIKIAYEDTIPQRATNYVNALVETFLKEAEINKNKLSDKILMFVNGQLNSVRKNLKDSERNLERYKVQNNIINTSTQSTVMIRKLSDVEIEISKANYKSTLINNVLQSIKRGDFGSVGTALSSFSDKGVDNSQINSLYKLELEEMSLSAEYTDEYPDLIRIRKQISSIKNGILLNVKSLKSSIRDEILNLKKFKKEYEQSLLNLPNKEIKLINLTKEYERNSKMYDYLEKKKSENEMIKVATTSDYKIIEEAYPPKLPIKPKRRLIMMMSMILGFIFAVVLAIVLNKSSNRIRTEEDIEQTIKLPIHGSIPLLKKIKKRNIGVFDNEYSHFTESFRRLRTDLQFSAKRENSNIILVTSTVRKEGRSTLVANLGAIFQLAGYKSIVIDLDLRNPSLHRYFDVDFSGGVSGYLSGRENMSDIIFSTVYPNLDIIPAGSTPSNPSELILSDRLGVMLKSLKGKYDYIFIDSSPIGYLTDTINIMNYTDINLVVFQGNKAKKTYIEQLDKMMVKYGLKNIELILNKG